MGKLKILWFSIISTIFSFLLFIKSSFADYTWDNPFIWLADSISWDTATSAGEIMATDLGTLIKFIIGFIVIISVLSIFVSVLNLKNKS